MQNGRIYLLHSLVYTSNSRRIKYNLQIHRISISTRRKIIVKMINEIGPSTPIAPMRKKKLNNINSSIKDIYVSDMPTLERQNLCNLLNEQTKIWETLAAEMQFTTKDIREIHMTKQQTCMPGPEILLAIWGDQINHTVTELFVVLARIQFYPAMLAIQHFVDERYHRLIKSKSWPQSIQKNTNDDGLQKQQAISRKILNVSVVNETSNENNESTQDNVVRNSDNIAHEQHIGDYNTIPKISYAELRSATRDWNVNGILGTGGFGTVFHGIWKCTEVAIKRIEPRDRRAAKIQIQQSLTELRYLNYCRHDNILPLYAYSMDDGHDPCLVYKFMAGGSVEQRLFRRKAHPPLQWQNRMNIAIGTARGLQYLHTINGKPLIHGDIKPANILLDTCLHPKIGDFGLAREGNFQDAEMEVSQLYGTRPYLPREFRINRTLSTKVDTYSFGIVLLELATGLRAYDKSYEYLRDHVRKFDDYTEYELMEKKLDENENQLQIFKRLMRQGKICSSADTNDRPAKMVYVLKELESEFI